MPPEKHALLGASSAERWLMCPPSARLGEQFPDTASEYAAAGTLAHAIAELKARKYFGAHEHPDVQRPAEEVERIPTTTRAWMPPQTPIWST